MDTNLLHGSDTYQKRFVPVTSLSGFYWGGRLRVSLPRNTTSTIHACIMGLPIALSLLITLVSVNSYADTTPPTAPCSLTGTRYSQTAGEILWDAAEDNDFIIGYNVTRDGEILGLKDARSVFEADLIADQSYVYTVSAVDQTGNIGPQLSVELPAEPGASQTVENNDGSGSSDTNPSCSEPVDELVLYTSHNRITLVEGDTTGFSISLSLDRVKAEKRAVTLTLESDAQRDMLGLRHVFSTTTLAPDESGSVLTLHLDVTQAPLMLHERYFNIVADDGETRTTTPLVIDVTPTAAPDVYLLIGQSNMEGYSETGSKESFPGGKDERVERIRQLNVQPNNPSFFSTDELFTDELANVRQPTFVIAEDPLHEPRYIEVDGKGATFVGLGLTFAKETLRTTTADLYLVPAAWGATGFCANANGDLAWNAEPPTESFLGGTLLVDRALTRLNMTLRESGGVLRGIIWHQGGADSNNPQCAENYAQNLLKLVDRLRSDARLDMRGDIARGVDAQIPFLVATQSKGNDERGDFSQFNPSKQQVDSVHRTVSELVPYSGSINNDDLVPPEYPCGQVSCVHFGAAALREQGRRFYALLKGIWSEMGAYHY